MEDAFEITKKAILNGLAAAKINAVVLEYSGQGDSGETYDISYPYSTNGDAHKNIKVEFALTKYSFTDKKQVMSLYTDTLENALEHFMDMILHNYHGGYENNEGGGGTVTIHVDHENPMNSKILLEKYDNEIDEELTHRTF